MQSLVATTSASSLKRPFLCLWTLIRAERTPCETVTFDHTLDRISVGCALFIRSMVLSFPQCARESVFARLIPMNSNPTDYVSFNAFLLAQQMKNNSNTNQLRTLYIISTQWFFTLSVNIATRLNIWIIGYKLRFTNLFNVIGRFNTIRLF